jgi:S-adenosylmethionine:tRNA ribosyltransferase-isomerase
VEILIERLLPDNGASRADRREQAPKPGTRIVLDAGGQAEVLGRDGEFYAALDVGRALEDWLAHAGRLPLPPYIHRDPGAGDIERYQTVFAREPRWPHPPPACISTKACWRPCTPRASKPATSPCMSVPAPSSRCAWTTSASTACTASGVGWKPGWWSVFTPRARGGRVVAVGTTVARSLETAARGGTLAPFAGETDIFPGYCFVAIDALFTNFHLPKAR